jgi:ATP-binding cassette subfamily C (CFTR/MRP) protein 1
MSNLPSEFSADDARQGVALPLSVEKTNPLAANQVPQSEVKQAYVEDESDEEDTFTGGMKLRDLGQGELQFPGIKREKWWYVFLPCVVDTRQLWRPRHLPPLPKATLEEAEVIPLSYVSTLSKLTFHVSPN